MYQFEETLSAARRDLLKLLDVVLGIGKKIEGLLHHQILFLKLLLLGLLGERVGLSLPDVGDEGGDGLLVLLDLSLAASQESVELLNLCGSPLLKLLHERAREPS